MAVNPGTVQKSKGWFTPKLQLEQGACGPGSDVDGLLAVSCDWTQQGPQCGSGGSLLALRVEPVCSQVRRQTFHRGLILWLLAIQGQG